MFTFLVTAEHAFAKAAEAIINFGKKELPLAIAGIPAAEAVATAVDPAAAAVIQTVGSAAQACLGKVLVAVTGGDALEQAAKTGTITIAATVDEINALKALAPAVSGVVQAIGLGHTLPAAAVPTPAPAK
jgi:hypothetical protein